MATFKVTKKTTVAKLKSEFQQQVGGLLHVYNGRSEAAEDATLVSLGAKEGVLECRTSRTVGKFEEAFQSELNLKVKVYTKDNWVKVLDGITLATVKDLPNGMTKAKMEEYLAYQRDEEEQPSDKKIDVEAVFSTIPEEYKNYPIVDIEFKKLEIPEDEATWQSYAESILGYDNEPMSVLYHGIPGGDEKADVVANTDHYYSEVISSAAYMKNKYEGEECTLYVSSFINCYAPSNVSLDTSCLSEIEDTIGVALNEYCDGGNKHWEDYEWSWDAPDDFIFRVTFNGRSDIFMAHNDGGINLIDLSNEQFDAMALKFAVDRAKKYNESLKSDSNEYHFHFKNKSGVVNDNYEYIVEPQFDDMWVSFYEDLLKVRIGNKWGFVNSDYQVVIEPNYQTVSDFTKGYANFCYEKRGLYGYINKSGDVVIEPKYKSALASKNPDAFEAWVKTTDGEEIKIDINENILERKEPKKPKHYDIEE